MSRRSAVFAALLAGGALLARANTSSSSPGSALPPPSTGGVAALEPLVRRLSTHRRVLVIGAHPDDEDTTLLALVARGMGGEAAYLSLSRGEGGQNLIGEELGTGLGLIRSQELQAARRLDGARQFFTRAYDFGYSKTLEETLRFWPREAILEDAVRIIRRFRPQIIVSVFSGTPRDGHGQHQMAGAIAREAFSSANDPNAFPSLTGEGLAPWQPVSLYRSTRFEREATTVTLPTGHVDPVTGRSYHQIAMASRSLHRSQDMGMLEPAGPNETRVAWVAGGGGTAAKDLFAGVDTRLRALAADLPDASRRKVIQERLDRVETLLRETHNRLTPSELSAAVPALASSLTELSMARALIPSDPPVPEAGVARLLEEKTAYAEQAIAAAAGVALDALADQETASPDESVPITVQVWNAGPEEIEVGDVTLRSPDGWTVPDSLAPRRKLSSGTLADWKLAVSIPEALPPTLPYYLRLSLSGGLYRWDRVPFAVLGQPFGPPALSAAVELKIAGVPVHLEREVVFRYRDQAFGEVRRPLRAVPKLDVAARPDLMVWPTHRHETRAIEVALTSNSPSALTGRLEVTAPPGWPAVGPIPFQLEKRGTRVVLRAPVRPPARLAEGRSSFVIHAVLEGGERYSLGIPLLDYDHIRSTPMPAHAHVALSAMDLKLPRLRKVAYVRGAADRVPDALAAAGIPIALLSPRQLEQGDLSGFDAIVIGSRAYETERALAAVNPRLLDYARGGGLLIVQYQQYAFVEGNFAARKLEISRPHDRVSDEAAPVTILEPGHPVFTTPNRIAERDWSGWVQERGLYFAGSWDPAYKPLIAMADPGEQPKRGVLLLTRVGKGHYIYTGLAFFRQLPAGVPGAYRLFANLLALRAGGAP